MLLSFEAGKGCKSAGSGWKYSDSLTKILAENQGFCNPN